MVDWTGLSVYGNLYFFLEISQLYISRLAVNVFIYFVSQSHMLEVCGWINGLSNMWFERENDIGVAA